MTKLYVIQDKMEKDLRSQGYMVKVKLLKEKDILSKLLVFGNIDLNKLWIETNQDGYLKDLIISARVITVKQVLPTVKLKARGLKNDEKDYLTVAEKRLQKRLDDIIDKYLEKI
jgi:hypothetical protein